jgi:hypothetical protein
MAALDARHGPGRHTSGNGEVDLPPATVHPGRSEGGADALVIHRASLTSIASLRLH